MGMSISFDEWEVYSKMNITARNEKMGAYNTVKVII